ncbi:unnamed protein product [Camellia sinensis]
MTLTGCKNTQMQQIKNLCNACDFLVLVQDCKWFFNYGRSFHYIHFFEFEVDKEADAENYVPKRRKRRERAKEAKQISRLQKFTAAMWRLLLFVTLVLALIAATYYGYKGLLWLSDWMNEVEVQRQRRRYP